MTWKKLGEWEGLEVWSDGRNGALVAVLSPREASLIFYAMSFPWSPWAGGVLGTENPSLSKALEARGALKLVVYEGLSYEVETLFEGGKG